MNYWAAAEGPGGYSKQLEGGEYTDLEPGATCTAAFNGTTAIRLSAAAGKPSLVPPGRNRSAALANGRHQA
jgi:hypothetical protein